MSKFSVTRCVMIPCSRVTSVLKVWSVDPLASDFSHTVTRTRRANIIPVQQTKRKRTHRTPDHNPLEQQANSVQSVSMRQGLSFRANRGYQRRSQLQNTTPKKKRRLSATMCTRDKHRANFPCPTLKIPREHSNHQQSLAFQTNPRSKSGRRAPTSSIGIKTPGSQKSSLTDHLLPPERATRPDTTSCQSPTSSLKRILPQTQKRSQKHPGHVE